MVTSSLLSTLILGTALRGGIIAVVDDESHPAIMDLRPINSDVIGGSDADTNAASRH